MVRLLIVEDDDAIRRSLTRELIAEGATVVAVGSAVEAMRSIASEEPDVVLLDLGLPDLDGRDVLALIRATSRLPVVITTARDSDREVVALLDAGADDYLVKPFSAAQAMARVRAVLRRVGAERDGAGTAPPGKVVVGDLVIDPGARSVVMAGRELSLNRKEFDLLLALASRAGQVVSKRQLLADVWQQPFGGADQTVDVHLSWLRRKLGETAAEPRYLISVHGVGVKLVAPTDEAGVRGA